METGYAVLTVLFEDPFWVGIYERREGRAYQVCKITFGAEPKDYEVYQYLLQNWNRLRFTSSIAVPAVTEKRLNPKRMRREIQKQLSASGTGTKAQQALQQQREQNKKLRAVRSREQLVAEKERRFHRHQQIRKEKHRVH